MSVGVPTLGRHSEPLQATLLEWIEQGRLREGGRLPPERELSRQFGVSRPTVRRALANMQAEGHVDIRKGSGTFVRPRRQADGYSDTISIMISKLPGRALTEVQDHLLSRGYLMCVFSQDRVDWDHDVERRFLQRVLEERHRAVLCFCSPVPPYNDDLLRKLVDKGTRVVHIDHYKTDLPEQEYLLPDYEQAGYRAAVSLMLAGHTKVRYASFIGSPYTVLIERGILRAVRDYNRDDNTEDVLARMSSKAEPDTQMLAKFRHAVESSGGSVGFVCRNPRQAGALRRAATEFGYRVPEQVGIACVADSNDLVSEDDTDVLEFDKPGIILRAVDHVLTNRSHPLRELVPPQWRRHTAASTTGD